MFFHFRETKGAFPTSEDGKPAPTTPEAEQDLVDRLQARKTDLYKDLIAEKAVLQILNQLRFFPSKKDFFLGLFALLSASPCLLGGLLLIL